MRSIRCLLVVHEVIVPRPETGASFHADASISIFSMPRSPDQIALGAVAAAPLVAVMTDRVDWHARVLLQALRARGARPVTAHLTDCRFDTGRPDGLLVDGCGDRLPDAVLVRTMSGGSFEAVPFGSDPPRPRRDGRHRME